MGQAVSHPPAAAEADKNRPRLDFPAPTATLPLRLTSERTGIVTTIISLGSVDASPFLLWHIEGGIKVYPFPPGYRAVCELAGHTLHCEIAQDPATGVAKFTVRTPDNQTFEGSTPTAPVAKWALALGRPDLCVSGMEAFGFAQPIVQALLRALGAVTGEVDTPPVQLQKGVAVGDWVARLQHAHAQRLRDQQAKPPADVSLQHRGMSLAPSLQNWLELTPSQQAQQLAGLGNGAGAVAAEGGGAVAAFPGAFGGSLGSGLPPRPGGSLALARQESRPAESELAALHAMHAGVGGRPGSRTTSRRRAGSSEGGRTSGRGWTAFTAFGMTARDAARAEHPGATATEIEKIVGQRWARLSVDEKATFAATAAAVRKSSSLAEGEGDLLRTRSDAATANLEDRKLRARRKPKQYGGDFDLGDFLVPGEGSEAVGGGDEEGGPSAAGPAKRRPGSASKRSRKRAPARAPLADDEQDVLGLLTDMRAEAIASESDDGGTVRNGGVKQEEGVDQEHGVVHKRPPGLADISVRTLNELEGVGDSP